MVRVSVVVEGVEGGGVLAAAELGAGAGQLAAHPAVAQLAVILALLPLGHNHSDSVSEGGKKSHVYSEYCENYFYTTKFC